MTGKKSGKQKPQDVEYHLHASITSYVTSSYYISGSGDKHSDEAIVDFEAEIVSITPKMSLHVGELLTCSLMCSRTYKPKVNYYSVGNTLLLYMRLRREIRLFSAYLPSDVFWALSSDLKGGRLKYIEAWFDKPRYGSGKLRSLYFSKTPDQQE